MRTPTPDNVARLAPNTPLEAFDCGDSDLNEFLLHDAVRYQSELLAVTYLVMEAGHIAAFYSLSNDMLTCDPVGDGKRIWNRMQRKIPNQKRLKNIPQ